MLIFSSSHLLGQLSSERCAQKGYEGYCVATTPSELRKSGLGAHARDELGISEVLSARPIQATLASAGSFAVGAAMPLLVTAIAPESVLIPLVSGTSLVFLTLLGGLAARAGGAGVTVGAIRVTFWGALAMAVTAGVGALFGTVA